MKTEVLIIGGGMAGILCAYMLQNAGVPYILAEADRICGGVTGNTTAKITAQHGLIYDNLLRRLGVERARQYYEANRQALERYRDICRGLDCDFETRDSYVYTRNDPGKLEKEMTALTHIGVQPQWAETTELPFCVDGAIRFPEQAQFHPLKFVKAIAKSLNIYEHTRVLSFDGSRYQTEQGTILPKRTIVATHFPMWNKHGLFPLKLYQDRSYVLALEGVKPVTGMYVDGSGKGLSFRMVGDQLLLGGGSHRTGKSGGGWAELEDAAVKHYPGGAEVHRWATQDCMSLDGMPYIGQYSSETPRLFVAAGFNKWGMTGAMAAAQVLCDLVQDKENPYAALFSPRRRMYFPQLAANACHAAVNLLTPTAPRCPHMGCALKWNCQEHSWDCPCHGSRFGADGTLLDNPATGNLKRR